MGLRAIVILAIFCAGALKSLQDPRIGIVFLAVITYIRPAKLSYGQLAQFRLMMIFTLVVIISYLINYSKVKKIENHSKVLLCLIILAFLQYLISPFAVYDSDLSFEFSTTFFKIIIFCFLMARILTEEKYIRWFFHANMFGVAFISIWGFQQHFLGNPRLEEVAGGQFDESNAVGTLCAHFVPITLSFLFFFKKWRWKLPTLLLSAILFADVIFTQSRSSLLGVVIGSFIFIMTLPTKQKLIIITLAILSLPLIQTAINSTSGYRERLEATASGESRGADRLNIWRAGYYMIKDHPLTGVGVRNFRYLAKSYCERFDLEHAFRRLADPHNNVLLFFAETGFLGGLLLVLAYFFHFRDIFYLKNKWKNSTDYSKYIPLLNGLWGGMIAFYVSSMFHSYPYAETFYYFLIFPGLIRNVYQDKMAHNP